MYKNLLILFSLGLVIYILEGGRVLTPRVNPIQTGLSIGINIESFQAESDGILQSVPSVNIALSARIFESKTKLQYDTNGYPLSVRPKDRVFSHLLYNYQPNVLPNNTVDVIFEGQGELKFSNLFYDAKQISTNHYNVKLKYANNDYERATFQIYRSVKGNHIRNIRIIMSGGICNNDYLNVSYKNKCNSSYTSFLSMYQKDPKLFMFNPDYIRFTKNFSTLRTMNLHETSQRPPNGCVSCVTFKSWNERIKMSSYSFGSSYKVNPLNRQGAPWELSTLLANEVYKYNKDVELYLVLPFNIKDEYIEKLGTLIKQTLNPNIKVILEYNNEAWNPRFHGALYMRQQGRIHNPEKDKNMYKEGYKFYVTKSIEVFNVFNRTFPRARTNRTLGTFQWNPSMTKNMLSYNDSYKHIDSVSMGTYFYMCYDENKCKDSTGILSFDTSTDIENYLKSPSNRYGIPKLIEAIKEHHKYTQQYNLDLISYEGGLHLTVQELQHKDSKHYVKMLNKFSNSKHAYNLYKLFLTRIIEQKMLNNWIVFTFPQTYHKWGPFGIKETLNGPGYKYEAVKEFIHSP